MQLKFSFLFFALSAFAQTNTPSPVPFPASQSCSAAAPVVPAGGMALAIYDANGCFYVQIPASAFSLIQAAAANPVQLPVGPAQNGHGPTTPVVYTVEGWAFHHFAQGLETVEKQARATAQQALVKQAVSAGATAAAPITTLRTTISQAELAAAQQQQLNQAAQVAPSPQAAQQ